MEEALHRGELTSMGLSLRVPGTEEVVHSPGMGRREMLDLNPACRVPAELG